MSIIENFKPFISSTKLSRISVVYAAMSHAFLIIVLSRNDPSYSGTAVYESPFFALILLSILLALSFGTMASILNDMLQDNYMRSVSIIIAKPITQNQRIVLVIGSVLMGILASASFGPYSVYYALATAVLILFYDATAKFVPALGACILAMITSVYMLIINPNFQFVLPLFWMSMHVLGVSLAIVSIDERRKKISTMNKLYVFIFICTFAFALSIQASFSINNMIPANILGWKLCFPLLASLSFIFIALWKVKSASTARSAAEKIRRYSALWQSLYASCWFFLLNLSWYALFALVATFIAYLILVALREFTGIRPENPFDFRV